MPSLLKFIGIISGFFAYSEDYLCLRVFLLSFITFEGSGIAIRETFTVFRVRLIITVLYSTIRFLRLFIIKIISIFIASVLRFIAIINFFNAY